MDGLSIYETNMLEELSQLEIQQEKIREDLIEMDYRREKLRNRKLKASLELAKNKILFAELNVSISSLTLYLEQSVQNMEVIALKRSTDIQEYNAGEYDITAVKLNKSLEGILNKYGEYLQENSQDAIEYSRIKKVLQELEESDEATLYFIENGDAQTNFELAEKKMNEEKSDFLQNEQQQRDGQRTLDDIKKKFSCVKKNIRSINADILNKKYESERLRNAKLVEQIRKIEEKLTSAQERAA